jgi:N6-adenosine-specific RNA methylase IME4
MTGWPFVGIEPGSAGTVVADVPWNHGIEQRLGGRGRRPAAAWQRYSTMSLHDLADLPVGDLIADQGHLWLWTTNLVLATGAHKPLLDAWHVRPVTILSWCKLGSPGLGVYLRGGSEHAVLAVKGWGTVPAVPHPSTWFQAAREPHSVKPASALDIIERVSPGPYVELFARQQRFGWSSWGYGHEIGESA